MTNSSKTLTDILAGIFAILFIATTALTFALYSVEKSAFNAQLYIQALDEENVYQRLPNLVAQTLNAAAQKSAPGNLLAILKNISEDEWQVFLVELLPPGELESLTEDTVSQLVAYINAENDEVVLSLVSLKNHLGSPQGINAIYGILKAQPDCTVDQLTAMALGQQAMTLCNPPDTFLFFDLQPVIEAEIKAAVTLIPEQVTIISADASQPQKLLDLKFLRMVMRLSPILPLLCLFMITLLAVRSLNTWLIWWGYPFLVAGLVSMSLTVISKTIAALTFQIFIAPFLPETLSLGIVNVLKDLTASIVSNAVEPVLNIAGILALIGLIMVAISFWVGVERKRSQETG